MLQVDSENGGRSHTNTTTSSSGIAIHDEQRTAPLLNLPSIPTIPREALYIFVRIRVTMFHCFLIG